MNRDRSGSESTSEVTTLLEAWAGGDEEAFDELLPHVYPELVHSARALMAREGPGHTLQATELVNEIYVRLRRYAPAKAPENRFQFRRLAIRMMRNHLVDHARHKRAERHGGGLDRTPWTEALLVGFDQRLAPYTLLDLDRAMEALRRLDPEGHDVVELHFWAGMTYEECGEVLDRNAERVRYKWRVCKPLLLRLMASSEESRDADRENPRFLPPRRSRE